MPQSLYLEGDSPVYIENVSGDVYIQNIPGATPSLIQSGEPSSVGRVSIPSGTLVPKTSPGPVRGGAGGLVRPGSEQEALDISTNAMIIGLNKRFEEEKAYMLTGVLSEYLIGAQMGIMAVKSVLNDKIFDARLKEMTDSVSPTRLPPVPPVTPPAPAMGYATVSFVSDSGDPSTAKATFLAKYPNSFQTLALGPVTESADSISFQIEPKNYQRLMDFANSERSYATTGVAMGISIVPLAHQSDPSVASDISNVTAQVGKIASTNPIIVGGGGGSGPGGILQPPNYDTSSRAEGMYGSASSVSPGDLNRDPSGSLSGEEYLRDSRGIDYPWFNEDTGGDVEGVVDDNSGLIDSRIELTCWDGMSRGPESLLYQQGQIPKCDGTWQTNEITCADGTIERFPEGAQTFVKPCLSHGGVRGGGGGGNDGGGGGDNGPSGPNAGGGGGGGGGDDVHKANPAPEDGEQGSCDGDVREDDYGNQYTCVGCGPYGDRIYADENGNHFSFSSGKPKQTNSNPRSCG